MSDSWRRFFPASSLGPLGGIAEWAGQALARLDETPLHLSGPREPLAVRLLWLPTWSPACSVRLEWSGRIWRLDGRRLSRAAGFDLGKLARRVDKPLDDDEAEQVARLWPYLRFWSLPAISQGEDVFDGDSFLLEAVECGRYHAACMDDPEWGDTFGEFCFLLLRVAGFLPQERTRV